MRPVSDPLTTRQRSEFDEPDPFEGHEARDASAGGSSTARATAIASTQRNYPGVPTSCSVRAVGVIFVHGGFWHGHEGCPANRTPNTRREFWRRKWRRRERGALNPLHPSGRAALPYDLTPLVNRAPHPIYNSIKVSHDLALPETQHRPPIALKCGRDLSIPLHVPLNLRDPPLGVRREKLLEGPKPPQSPSVSVPEVTVDEDSDTSAHKYEVRLADEPTVVLTVSVALRPESSSYAQFGFRVLRPDACHYSRCDCGIPGARHRQINFGSTSTRSMCFGGDSDPTSLRSRTRLICVAKSSMTCTGAAFPI